MGLFQSKERDTKSQKSQKTQSTGKAPAAPVATAKWSWDSGVHAPAPQGKPDPKDFILSKRRGEKIFRAPGTINGQQFIIEDCQDCDIYLCDHSETITVDDCVNCRIFIGPVAGSLFLRDCKSCQFAVACQQFRTRTISKCDVLLYCATQPIIEDTTGLRLGCFRANYFSLKGQFDAAKMSVFNNRWSQIYDFTRAADNWSFLPETTTLTDLMSPLSSVCTAITAEEESAPSLVIPHTYCTRPLPESSKTSFVLFYPGRSTEAMRFIERVVANGAGIANTKEAELSKAEATQLLSQCSAANKQELIGEITKGPVIGVQMFGNTELEHKQVVTDLDLSSSCVHLSQGDEESKFMASYLFETLQK